MAYDIKKTLWKIGKAAIYVVLAGLASVYGESPYYLVIAPVFSGLENFLKHRKD